VGNQYRKNIKDWRKLHNDALQNFKVLPDVIKMIKSGTMRWSEHVACVMADIRNTNFWWEELKRRYSQTS
jgi:hypothetical protein